MTEAFHLESATAFSAGFAAGNALGGSLVNWPATGSFLVAAGGVAAAVGLARLRRPVLAPAGQNAGGHRRVGSSGMMGTCWHALQALPARHQGVARRGAARLGVRPRLPAGRSPATCSCWPCRPWPRWSSLLVQELLNSAIPQGSFTWST